MPRKRVLAGIGTFVGAVIAAILQFEDIRSFMSSVRAPEEDRPPELQKLDRKRCCALAIRHPETIPLHLFPHLPHRRHFPYWFKVEAENSCGEELTIDIEFERFRGPFAIDKDSETFSDTLPVGDYSRQINPEITISNYDADGPMVIKWSVRDELGTRLGRGVTEIELLPRSTIVWDLRNVDGQPVPREYLLAALAAWTATSFPGLDEMAATCGEVEETATLRESAARLEECHRRLFKEENPVFFSSLPLRFPDTGRQTVLPPFEVLEKRHANQIEAALLFAAVGRRLGPRFRLISRPHPGGDPELKNFLLAWQSTPTAQWRAIDLAKVLGTGFEDNLRAGTAELGRLQQSQPEMFRALESTGVYLDDSHTAIDFRQADRHYDIGPLPS